MISSPRRFSLLVLALVAGSGCAPKDPVTGTDTGTPCPVETGEGCAPDSQRVDLYDPVFSDPLRVSNPLFPIQDLASVVFIGWVDDAPFRTETTLLPGTRTYEWKGQTIETLQSQYTSFRDGRIEEIAIDSYAQDDVGAVWYLGEDVLDYNEDGVPYTDEGTWQVGVDGAPVTMIMPASPEVGDAFLAENVAPVAWEQIIVTEVDLTVDGPTGPVSGVVVGSELHLDGATEDKLFAPGYGEFQTGTLAGNNLEALALAVPTDAVDGSSPAELDTMAASTADVFDAAGTDWAAASAAMGVFVGAWEAYQVAEVPPLLADEMDRLLADLAVAVDAQDAREARHQVIAVARVTWDLRLRYQAATEVDPVRLDLWFAQAQVDLEAGDYGSVRGDAAIALLVWNRFAHTYDSSSAAVIGGLLDTWSSAAAADDATTLSSTLTALRAELAGAGW